MMKVFVRSFVLGAALVVSGCVSLLPETPPAKPRYNIGAVDAGAVAGAPVDWTLTIDEPRTTRVYDNVKLAVSSAPEKIEYYGRAEWADRAPHLFQIALIQSFEDSGRILVVGNKDVVPTGKHLLQMDIRSIVLTVRDGQHTTDANVFARLGDGRGKIYATKLFTVSKPAGSGDADDVVRAFGQALDQIITEMVIWTFDEGDTAEAADS